MKRAFLGLVLAASVVGCAGDLAGAQLVYQLKLQSSPVPATAMFVEPQVWVEDPYSTKWKASSPIAAASLAGLTKRDQVSLLLRVSSADVASRVAPVTRFFDDKQQLVAVGGGQLALFNDAVYSITLVEVSDARLLPLQVAKFAPASALAGRTVTMYGWGFSPEAAISIGGQSVTDKQWLSPVEMVVRIPNAVAAGPLEVTVQNPDGTRDFRTDLLTAQ